MFRLSKYELRKNRTALFVLLAGLAALQICFLIALRGKTQDYAIIWSTILVLYAVVCYFAVFIFAITNYYREINSKTSYLVFMTPVSALSIILSKMLTVLVLGVILAAALGALGWLDFSLFLNHYSVYKSMGEVISEVMKNFGIDTGSINGAVWYYYVSAFCVFYSGYALSLHYTGGNTLAKQQIEACCYDCAFCGWHICRVKDSRRNYRSASDGIS